MPKSFSGLVAIIDRYPTRIQGRICSKRIPKGREKAKTANPKTTHPGLTSERDATQRRTKKVSPGPGQARQPGKNRFLLFPPRPELSRPEPKKGPSARTRRRTGSEPKNESCHMHAWA